MKFDRNNILKHIENLTHLSSDELLKYDKLLDNKRLGDNTIFLTLGGSWAYGTNVDGSDVDLRGCVLNSKEEILTNKNFEQLEDKETDTVIYAFNKFVKLLSDCNPNIIELLGNKPEFYVYISPIGEELLNNKRMFLSQKAIYTFGGYANAQLQRLNNKAVIDQNALDREKHILNVINHAKDSFPERYFRFPDDSISLYLDDAIQEEFDKEIFMDINLTHYPLRDYKNMWSEMKEIVKQYGKIGHRNRYAATHDRLGKHMMHLIRLYMMLIDILEKEEIVTCRTNEHELLMSIRNGDFLDEKDKPTEDFFDLVHEYEKKVEYAKKNTNLPTKPNYKEIQEFIMSVNERVVLDNY